MDTIDEHAPLECRRERPEVACGQMRDPASFKGGQVRASLDDGRHLPRETSGTEPIVIVPLDEHVSTGHRASLVPLGADRMMRSQPKVLHVGLSGHQVVNRIRSVIHHNQLFVRIILPTKAFEAERDKCAASTGRQNQSPAPSAPNASSPSSSCIALSDQARRFSATIV